MKRPKNLQFDTQHRSAFTLIEMMVSVTLILLIMSIFAGIFSLATDSVKSQRAISENDQVARALITVLRNDFAKRSNRYVFPYYHQEEPSTSPTPFGNRAGYVYINANNPHSYHDDIVQFTVDVRTLQQSQDQTQYFGAATLLGGLNLYAHPNQPEADDGVMNPNGVAASSAAEIAIFMRNGKLYRRVSLLREPLPFAGKDLDIQPHDNTPSPLPVPEDFWRYFDFSARPFGDPLAPTRAEFVGIDSLNNESASGLGLPHNRFGFDPRTGQSREHDNATTLSFMGRYTHAETSHSEFGWPVAAATVARFVSGTNGNPMDIASTPVTLPSGADIVSELQVEPMPPASLRGGPRRMEDVLLSNVHEFRVELWDERLGRFVIPGYGTPNGVAAGESIGDFHITRNLQNDFTLPNPAYRYGPLVPLSATAADARPHIFDTWHANVTDLNDDATKDLPETLPPYMPYRVYPPRQSDSPPGPSSSLAPPDGASYWLENAPYAENEVVFARNVSNSTGTNYDGWDADPGSLGVFNWELDSAAAADTLLYPPGSNLPAQYFQIAYRCVSPRTGTGTTSATPPSWPRTPGSRVVDGGVIWEAFDNRLPLKSIRLTVRFKTASSENIRQVSQIISLLDK